MLLRDVSMQADYPQVPEGADTPFENHLPPPPLRPHADQAVNVRARVSTWRRDVSNLGANVGPKHVLLSTSDPRLLQDPMVHCVDLNPKARTDSTS